MRPHCLQIVKFILFFYFVGPAFFSYYFFLSPFLVFLPSLILALRAPNHFSAISLSPSPSTRRSASLSDETQAGASRQADLYCSGFFLVCDLMVDSAVVVWVMDLAGVGIGVDGRSAWLCGFFSSLLIGSLSFFSPMNRGGGGSWIMVEICSD